jgi:hypothetical protein
MSAQGKINSLKAGTAGVEVMQWAVRELQELSNLVQLLRVGQPNIDYDKELLKPTFVGRELTDEEIANIWDDVRKGATLKPSMKDIQDFAKAILRKAQEK